MWVTPTALTKELSEISDAVSGMINLIQLQHYDDSMGGLGFYGMLGFSLLAP